MKRFLLQMLFLLLTGSSAFALTVAGVPLEPAASLNGQSLPLNGAGLRSKLFVKVYVGALYAERKLSSAAAVLADPGSKIIRMRFIHSKVAKEKIVDAFAEGFAKNSPQLVGKAEVREFLSLFKSDFVAGDTVDIALAADGTVSASQNGRPLGVVRSATLARGILGIYFGDEPADKDLKAGMLGREG